MYGRLVKFHKFYSLAFVHLVVTAVVTLMIDVSEDEDPRVRAYSRVRWKLLTALFNLTSLVYLPVCLYCDWREKHGDEPPHVAQLRVLRDVVMTSLLMPITTYSDVLFWILYMTHPDIIAPPAVFEYLPSWIQHSLHTVSMIVVIMDLILTPRQRPDNMKPRLTVIIGFATGYSLMVYESLLDGEPVYAFFAASGSSFCIAVYFAFLTILIFVYYTQWLFIDYIWGKRTNLDQTFSKIK